MGEARFAYPIFLSIRDRTCVVVGGGKVGERKVNGLLEAGACVRVVSPETTEHLAQLAKAGKIELVPRPFAEGDLKDAVLVFATTDHPEVNREVAAEAESIRALSNVSDASVEGDFVLPSVVERGIIRVAFSTGGASPAYARLIRERLEDLLGPEQEELVELCERLRPEVMARFPDDGDRRRCVWDRLVTWETIELIRQRKWDEIEEKVAACLS